MANNDRFAGIREFVATVDGASFTAAALALGVTSSAIGKSVSRLEARLGVQLLHRTTRRIGLTSEGESYLASCRRVLEELDQSEAFLSTGHRQPMGRVHIDLPTTFGRRHILPALLELALRHEELDLSVSFRDQAVDLVGEGVDLAVRIGALADSADIVARRLGQQRLVICAAPDYLARRGMPLTRFDLAAHDCLIGTRRGLRSSWLLQDDQGNSAAHEIRFRHEMADGDALLGACIAGCGLAQMPTWLADEALRAGRLTPVLADIAGGAMPIHVIWQKTRHLQTKIRVVVDDLLALASSNGSVFNPP
jgi:DNA-binding transcriptional LysR family regulator